MSGPAGPTRAGPLSRVPLRTQLLLLLTGTIAVVVLAMSLAGTAALRTYHGRTVHVGIRAGTDVAFLGGLVNYVLTHGKWFEEYVRAYTNAGTIIEGEVVPEPGSTTIPGQIDPGPSRPRA